MSEPELNYLDRFPAWLRTLGEDAERVGQIAAQPELPEPARQALVAGVNYLFKSLDLVPDGIDDIGYLDDAFVLRVAAQQAANEGAAGNLPDEQLRVLSRLADDAQVIEDFLGSDYRRLSQYVAGLRKVTARGRSVAEILQNPDVGSAFASDLRGFAQSYEAPSFAREEKNLVKLRAFFDAKLPR